MSANMSDGQENTMGNCHLKTIGLATLIFVLLLGCTKSVPESDLTALRGPVEKLYLNYHALKAVHSDLHAAARRHIEASGSQLAEIQSAARFVHQANLIAYYQWELLSITNYIRDRSRSDFFTLRVKDIADARQQSKDLILAIKVYDAFIRDPQALSLIAKSIAHIEQNVALFETIHALMLPLSNPPPAPATGVAQESI